MAARVGILMVLVTTVVVVAIFCVYTRNKGAFLTKEAERTHILQLNEVLYSYSPKVSNHTLLVVVILCRPTAIESRNAIRNTWAKFYQDKPNIVLVRFSIGTGGLSSKELSELVNEQKTYEDLMLLKDVRDSYGNLTLKVLKSFLFANENYKFSYILKSDDDSYIILEKIVAELEHRKSNQSFYWGYMYIKGKVYKKGKYAEHKWFLSNTYLPYAQGSGYILSSDLIKFMSVKPENLMFYNNEDVSVGTWISPYDIERKNDNRLSHNFKCNKEAIVFNPVPNQKMFKMYKDLTKKGSAC